MAVDKIDTSHWTKKDSDWKEERKKNWVAIEEILSLNRRKSEVGVIKQYYLRGKMPNWEKYKNWDDLYRPLDLFIFLWLHPSNDFEILKSLYMDYMESDLIHERDITLGYSSFLQNEFIMSTAPYKSMNEYPYPYLGEKNIVLFRILFSDVRYAKENMTRLGSNKSLTDKRIYYIFNFLGYKHFLMIANWLKQDWEFPLAFTNLYQYNDVFEWFLNETLSNDEEFKDCYGIPKRIKGFVTALNVIYHFDFEKEGDTPRADFVSRLLDIMDSFDFIPEFKTLWSEVKDGRTK